LREKGVFVSHGVRPSVVPNPVINANVIEKSNISGISNLTAIKVGTWETLGICQKIYINGRGNIKAKSTTFLCCKKN